jgi:DNA-binding NarL/FixJ family response regulator
MSRTRATRRKNPKPPAPIASAAQAGAKGMEVKRALLADFCRVWGDRVTGARPVAGKSIPASPIASPPASPADSPIQGDAPGETRLNRPLSRRLRQTLDLLLAGEGEKQIALKLTLSQHTVHDYVKAVYRLFGVNTRAELLALWVRKGKEIAED